MGLVEEIDAQLRRPASQRALVDRLTPQITTALIREARLFYPIFERLAGPAGMERVSTWLTAVGVVTNSGNNKHPGDVEIEIAARASLLMNHPAGCFNQASLVAAAREFSWFPSGKELFDLLDPIADTIRRKKRGLEAMLRAHDTKTSVLGIEDDAKITKRDRKAGASFFRSLGQAIAAQDHAALDALEKQYSKSDK